MAPRAHAGSFVCAFMRGDGGPVIAGDQLFIMSGFSMLNIGLPGNVLLAFAFK